MGTFTKIADKRAEDVVDVSYWKLRFDDTGTYLYIGRALPGVATSEEKWQIKRITVANDNIDWADGEPFFDKEWDERAGYTYS